MCVFRGFHTDEQFFTPKLVPGLRHVCSSFPDPSHHSILRVESMCSAAKTFCVALHYISKSCVAKLATEHILLTKEYVFRLRAIMKHIIVSATSQQDIHLHTTLHDGVLHHGACPRNIGLRKHHRRTHPSCVVLLGKGGGPITNTPIAHCRGLIDFCIGAFALSLPLILASYWVSAFGFCL